MIDFRPIQTPYTQKVDWVFFSSSRSIQFYFAQNEPNQEVRYACVGPVSAAALRKYADTVDFVGEGGDTSLIGKHFNQVATGKVLFPQSNLSHQNIQKCITNAEVIDYPVYETLHKPERVSDHDIYIFSSPSNVNSFLTLNAIPKEAKVIAIGETTGNYLKNIIQNPIFISEQPTEKHIIQKIKDITDGIIQ